MNRESIRLHGLDWKRMVEHERGIAGSTEPELEAIFLCENLAEAEFFVEFRQEDGVDIWAVEPEGLPVEDYPQGWLICRQPISPERVKLFEPNAKVGPESGRTGVKVVWKNGWNWETADSDVDARV